MKRLGCALLLAGCSLAMPPWVLAQRVHSYGDWISGRADDSSYFYAATASASGDVLGKFCYPGENVCRWILAMNVRCRTGSTEVALFNSRQGAVSHELTCGGPYRGDGGTLYRYIIHDPEDIDNRVAADHGMLGIAYPLQSGSFQAEHFSMRGAVPALSASLAAAAAARRHDQAAPPAQAPQPRQPDSPSTF